MGGFKSKEMEAPPPIIADAIPITNEERKLSQAKVVGVEDPESEVRSVLNVGKEMSWNEIEKVLLSTEDSVSFRYRALTLAHDKAPSKDQMVDLMERALKVRSVRALRVGPWRSLEKVYNCITHSYHWILDNYECRLCHSLISLNITKS